VLPSGFVRIRHFGFVAHRRRAALLPLCFQFLGRRTDLPPASKHPPEDDQEGAFISLPSASSWTCPRCGGPMIILERLRWGTQIHFRCRHRPCEALMKLDILIRLSWVCPPRSRTRVSSPLSATPLTAFSPLAPSPSALGWIPQTPIFPEEQPPCSPLRPFNWHLSPIQNP
jgi:hypothetical protein